MGRAEAVYRARIDLDRPFMDREAPTQVGACGRPGRPGPTGEWAPPRTVRRCASSGGGTGGRCPRRICRGASPCGAARDRRPRRFRGVDWRCGVDAATIRHCDLSRRLRAHMPRRLNC
ncbi:hypothetical protein SEVIR_9G083450v4 [Setaria viridis]